MTSTMEPAAAGHLDEAPAADSRRSIPLLGIAAVLLAFVSEKPLATIVEGIQAEPQTLPEPLSG